ncbi:hypothetical protein [Proteocatella sphenisci]|uniref:hypothetical protein n=1 Tax=Proteocatella sphenisci TaxID=181070 RepID=UPI00049003C6|nr:hypothetical protein [Proteocatella sphenisci]
MVKGIEIFENFFRDFSQEYILIGGTACDLLMDEAGLDFRATKDLDIVLIVEALTETFGVRFWEFITSGEYEIREKSNGKPELYRFSKPRVKGYPVMIELFSKTSKEILKSENIVPIHISDNISSLSAILLDEDYYNFLIEGRVFVKGIPVLNELHLIPFKAKAWLDLSLRKELGNNIDSKDINKHKNDIFRLSVLISKNKTVSLNGSILNDMIRFVDLIKDEPVDLKAMGIKSSTKEDIIDIFIKIYLS